MKKLFLLLAPLIFMVGCGEPTAPDNQAPHIIGVYANPQVIKACPTFTCGPAFQSRLTCNAEDPNGDRLEYNWDVPGCNITQGSEHDSAIVIMCDIEGYYIPTCTVEDPFGGTDTDHTFVTVCNNCI